MFSRLFKLSALAVLTLTSAAAKADPILYVSTYSDNKIYKVLPDGSKTVFGPTLAGGGEMAFDTQGNLYESNYDAGTIFKIAPSGISTTFASGLHNPYGLAFDTGGNLYVSSANAGTTITKITPDGAKSTFATGLAQPQEITFDKFGNLFTENPFVGTVSKIDPLGNVSTFLSGLPLPHSMAIDSAGFIYVAEITGVQNAAGSVSILKYDQSGTFVSTFASGLNNTYTLLFGNDGNMYVATYPFSGPVNGGSILQITPSGTVSTYLSNITDPTGLAIQVPEPASLCLFAGSAGLLLLRRRIRKM
jgi:sugar lactone lactonase YvrE